MQYTAEHHRRFEPLSLSSATLVFLLLVGLHGDAVAVTTVTLTPSADTSLFSNNPDHSSGSGVTLFAGVTGQGHLRHALLSFDVASALPAGAIVEDAELEMTVFLNTVRRDPAGDLFSVHRLTSDWGESTSDSGPKGGQGIAAADGDATWRSSRHDATVWGAPGGDYVGVASATEPIDAVVNDITSTTVAWSGAGIVSDVQGWASSTTDNFGWLVRGQDSIERFSARGFGSRERGDGVPQLTIRYSLIPEPSTAVLAAIGTSLSTRRRRVRIQSN